MGANDWSLITGDVSGLEAATLDRRVWLENHVELVAGRHERVRRFESAEATQRRVVAAVAVVDGHVIVGAFVVRLYLKFVEDLQCRSTMPI